MDRHRGVTTTTGAAGESTTGGALPYPRTAVHPSRPPRLRVPRALRGARDDESGEALSRVADTVGSPDDPAEVLPALADVMRSALDLAYIGIHVRLADGTVEGTERGDPAGQRLVVLPLHHQDLQIGELVLGPGRGRDLFGQGERRLIEPLLAQVAAAAHHVLLHRQLHRWLERVVSVREEERRRLRRDIHDALGPSLAAGALRLETAYGLVSKSPEQAETVIEEVIALQRRVIDEMRTLVDALRPPVLDQLGLVAALRQQLDGFTGDGERRAPVILLTSPDRVVLPAALEVAAYRIVSEALANACRHARAARIDIRIGVVAGRCVIEVEDDGIGIRPGTRAGVGLLSIRERVEEVGGTSSVRRGAGRGTLLRAELPIPRPAGEVPVDPA